jgi:hypothetical protein
MKRAIVALALVACSGQSGPDCKTRVAELMTFLQAMDHSIAVSYEPSAHLVMRQELPSKDPPDAPVMTLVGGKTFLDGKAYALTELGDALVAAKQHMDETIEKRHLEGRLDSRHVMLALDENATWGDFVLAIETVTRAGLDRPVLVYGKASLVTAPPRVPFDDKIDAIQKGGPDSATELARLASDVAKPCPALGKVFGAVAPEEGTDKAKAIIDGSGPALLDCKCAADVASFRALMWRIAGNLHPNGLLELTIDKTGEQVAFPAATPWREAGKRIGMASTIWPSATP